MNNIFSKIADTLDRLSIKIQAKSKESNLYSMTRKQLINALKQQQLEIEELRQTNQDLISAITQYIDDLHKINEGNLAIRLKVGGCIFGHVADCINSIVEDLEKAVQILPVTHPLKEKYSLGLKQKK